MNLSSGITSIHDRNRKTYIEDIQKIATAIERSTESEIASSHDFNTLYYHKTMDTKT
jgi:hypothetical protein